MKNRAFEARPMVKFATMIMAAAFAGQQYPERTSVREATKNAFLI
jgi:hypothetical protein